MKTTSKPCPTRVTARWHRTAFSEANFWAFVDSTGWGRRTTDYNAIKENLMSRLSPQQAKKMRGILDKKTGELRRAISQWERSNDDLPVSDDSYSDLLAHIVGMGRREFANNLRNPELAYERATKGDYEESFSYALPYESDYRKNKNLQEPQRGDLFQEGDRVYLSSLPPQLEKGFRNEAKRMGMAAQKALKAYNAFEAALSEAGQAERSLQKLRRVMLQYVEKNSPEGVDPGDLLWISYHMVDYRHGQSLDEKAQAYLDGANKLMKLK